GPDPGPDPDRDGAPVAGEPWVAGESLVWCLAAGLVLLALGTLTGRPDVAVIGVPLVLGSLLPLWSRPRGPVWADVDRATGDSSRADGDGDSGRGAGGRPVLRAVLRLVAPPGGDGVRVRVSRPGYEHVEAVVHVPLRRELDLAAASVRTGVQETFTVEHQGIGAGAHLTGPVDRTEPEQVLVLPRGRTMPGLPLPRRLRGLTGQHESRRPGDGGGLRDVHPFSPGDSPRRVDWRVTARRSPDLDELYVRRTVSLAEAVVTLVVDSRDDVGPDPSTWSGQRPIRPDDATSLDLARQAAVTVAEGYLAAGDRVGVEDLGVRRRALRPGAGRRQLDRVVHQLALLRPEGDPPRRLRPPQIPSGALVFVFSTFLDGEAASLAQVWHRHGHRVVAVDVLPRVRQRTLDRRERLALRILTVEREDRMAQVLGAGVEIVHWADPAQATREIQQLARAHRRPGAGVGR
ncbi:hypothetical protein N869_05650, partial [Cellulomonas bogoriensis 69B4 = DSM 16987]